MLFTSVPRSFYAMLKMRLSHDQVIKLVEYLGDFVPAFLFVVCLELEVMPTSQMT